MILLSLAVAIILAIPKIIRRHQRIRKQQVLRRQFRCSLQTMVHGLKVGAGFHQVLERTARDSDPPLSREWQSVLHSFRAGRSLAEALVDLKRRVPLREIQWFVSAVQITQQSGGSLAGVLETFAMSLLERETLREKVAALTAQGKASGIVLSAMPFLLMAVLFCVAPGLIRPLFVTSAGQSLLALVIVMVALGGVVIFKIVSLPEDA